VRITDVVTPKELDQILARELNDIKGLGWRIDLQAKYIRDLSTRLSDEYIKVITTHIDHEYQASGMMRLLCLLDRFLEEKYANTSHTTN
jgi:hypothetical protein